MCPWGQLVEAFLCVVSESKSGLLQIPRSTELLLTPGLQFLELLSLQRTLGMKASFSLMCYVVKQP